MISKEIQKSEQKYEKVCRSVKKCAEVQKSVQKYEKVQTKNRLLYYREYN